MILANRVSSKKRGTPVQKMAGACSNTPDRASEVYRSMTTNTRQAKKSTDPRPAYIRLGVDNRGAHHCYDTRTETIHIIHDDGSRERKLLDDDHDVDDWMDAVDGSWGWDTQRYGQSLGDMLIDVLEVA
jgi:hypothetical protein